MADRPLRIGNLIHAVLLAVAALTLGLGLAGLLSAHRAPPTLCMGHVVVMAGRCP